jgi:hypothetical protein
LEMCWGFYPLNTNAIKFIIIRIILYNWQENNDFHTF